MHNFNITEVLTHYAIAALWSTNDDNGNPLDDNHNLGCITPATLANMREDCEAFVKANIKLLIKANYTEAQTGHDFWLTRNHHGVGFWGRGLGKVGDKLAKAAELFEEVNLYVGDDGLIHSM